VIGIVADDITGANDIGTMFAKAGYVTHVYPLESFPPAPPQRAFDGGSNPSFVGGSNSSFVGATDPASARERPDVVVLDTASRLDPPETAYAKAREATEKLRLAGASLWINKTCSVFRGNVGPAFDAMLDALGEPFAVVALGFPKNGRTTVDGIHYVRGVPLERSEFRYDPVHPMTSSDLVEILRSQTSRPVERLGERTSALRPERLRERLELARSRGGYVILDVESQRDLRTIARAVGRDYVLCGSSGLAEELAPLLRETPSATGDEGAPPAPGDEGAPPAPGDEDAPSAPGSREAPPPPNVREGEAASRAPSRDAFAPPPPLANVGILCVAGSLMPQTALQIEALRAQGVPAFAFDPRERLEAEDAWPERAARLVDALCRELLAGRDAVLHTAYDPHIVAETKRLGAARGWSGAETSRTVSETVAELAAAAVARTGQNRLLTAGGETSAAVCARLGIAGMRIWREIEPGLPSCVSLASPPMMLALKSGSFGSREFFRAALEHLRGADTVL